MLGSAIAESDESQRAGAAALQPSLTARSPARGRGCPRPTGGGECVCWWGLVPRLRSPVQNGDGGSDEHPDAAGGGRLPGAAGERCTGPGSCEMKGGSQACPAQRLLGGAGSAIASTPNPSKRSFPTRGGPLLPSPKAMHHASGCEGGLVRCPMAKGHPAPPSIMMMLRGWPLAGSAQFGAHPKHTHTHTPHLRPLFHAPPLAHPLEPS